MSNLKAQTKHLIIAPKESRRAKFWIQLLEQNNLSYLHLSYLDIISDYFSLEKDIQYIVRLESAGEDFETYQSIIHFEKNATNQILAKENFGELSNFESWYIGWEKVLKKIKDLENIFQLKFINEPLDIALAFNKKATQKLLLENKVSCPEILTSTSYESLISEMKAKKIAQVFIKPIAGSSASGIMAFRYFDSEKQKAYSTVKKKNGNFYNSLKVQTYETKEAIKEVFNEIAKSELQIERWVPKWQFNKMNVDFRVVVINKKVEFIVPRGSRSPITNLHLGNQKLKLEDLNLSSEIIEKIKQIALETMLCFPGLHYAGIDVLLSKKAKVYVLEVNPFGDMLLNIVNEKGNTTYEQELESLI